jgi:hypothetical protein
MSQTSLKNVFNEMCVAIDVCLKSNMGCLRFDDEMFCGQITKLLQSYLQSFHC